MDYRIIGACTSNVGNEREHNEDNFFFDGNLLEEENNGISEVLTCSFSNSDLKSFAIFDGMGGESKGEKAAYLGAKTLKEYITKNRIIEWDEFSYQANDVICKEMKNKSRMGSTMAGIQFRQNDICISNLGDSRIYLLSQSSFGQISKDHVEKQNKNTNRKARLTQYLGIWEDEMIIQPFIKNINYENIEKIMICSDGISDMVSQSEMENILVNNNNPKNCVEKLVEEALNNGGIDNITVMVFTVDKIEKKDNKRDAINSIKKIIDLFK